MFQASSREAKLREMFSRLAGADNEIDSEELQDVLTASLSSGMSAIIIYCKYSLYSCRYEQICFLY